MNVCYLRDGDQVFETYWTTGRGNETMGSSYAMLDQTVYGRQESWEDSPEGWPRVYLGTQSEQMRTDENGRSVGRPDGRPISQWPRLAPATPTTSVPPPSSATPSGSPSATRGRRHGSGPGRERGAVDRPDRQG